MENLEHGTHVDLLSTLAGKLAAQLLMEQYGELTNLAQASFDELQQVKGIGKSKAAAIKSAFLLGQRPPRFFVNVPLPLAAALDLTAGEEVQWQLLNRSDLRLKRLAAPPASPRTKK